MIVTERRTMTLWIGVIALLMAATAQAVGVGGEEPSNDGRTCSGDGKKIRQFSGRRELTMMPCKYRALQRQKCGDVKVSLTPGNIFFNDKYRVETLWLSLRDATTNAVIWKGRTTNNKVIGFVSGKLTADETLVTKDGSGPASAVFDVTIKDSKLVATAQNGEVRVTFKPYDPAGKNKEFKRSEWEFTCSSEKFSAKGYPEQICGGDKEVEREAAKRRDELGLDSRSQLIYYDVFGKEGMLQTDQTCNKAETIMTAKCEDDDQRVAAIKMCSDIMLVEKESGCLRDNSYNPMEVFVNCLKWMCGRSESNRRAACKAVGDAVSNCKKDFKDLRKELKKGDC